MIGTGVERALDRNTLRDTHLRIAAGDSAAKWYLAPIIREFASLYPNVVIRIMAGKTADTLALLQERKADIGLVNMPISADGIIFEECLTLHDVFIAGKEYENLKNRTVSLQELTTYPLIMLDGSCRSRKWVDRHFNAHGAMILSSLVISSHELMPEYVRAGLGIACVVDEFSHQTLASGDVYRVELEDPVPERSLGICFRSDTPLSPSAEKLIELAKRRG
jgi:DNA-binding transcriptional LysR family regulator